jgi:CelD/BcsL family acetyltransferase involved in cellulose biosynthesis
MLKINEVTTKDKFNELRKDWNEVLERSKDDTVFLTWENVANSVKYLEKEKALRILYITAGDRIVAIAPLKKSRYTLSGSFGYDVIEPLAYRNSDYTGLIIAEKESECLKLFLKFLYKQNDWNFIYFYDFPETSLVFNLLDSERCAFPKFEIGKGRICPYMSLPESISSLMPRWSGKFRKNLRRSLKRLEEDFGKVELKEYNELGSLKDGMQLFFTLHQKRWTLKGQPGVFNVQKIREMSLESAELLEEKGWLGLFFLMVNNIPIATQYCLQYKQKMHYGLGGFDPDYSSYSVGNLITLKVIEKCIEKKIREYDFMKGDELYKFDWSQEYRRNMNLTFVNEKLTSKLLRFGIRTAKRINLA